MIAQELISDDRTIVGLNVMNWALILFAGITTLMAIDIVDDYYSGADFSHLSAESIVTILGLIGVVCGWTQFRYLQRRAQQLKIGLNAARQEAEQFRQEAHDALRGLGEAIVAQLNRWGLSPAESEVALLLLKGLSHKEIAELRSTNETTIRQQALAVYRKSGLRSRTELSAFFLEDLWLPLAN